MQAPFPPGKGAFRLNGLLRREECRNTAGRAEPLDRSSGAEPLETFRRAEHLKASGWKSARPGLRFPAVLRQEGACRLHKGRGRQEMRRSVTAPERRPAGRGKKAQCSERRAPFSPVSRVRKAGCFRGERCVCSAEASEAHARRHLPSGCRFRPAEAPEGDRRCLPAGSRSLPRGRCGPAGCPPGGPFLSRRESGCRRKGGERSGGKKPPYLPGMAVHAAGGEKSA